MSSSEVECRNAERAEIVTIGDELCAARSSTPTPPSSPSGCSSSGYDAGEQRGRADDGRRSAAALVRLRAEVDVIVATGGLGPTEDDRTVDVVAELLGDRHRRRRASPSAMEKRFADPRLRDDAEQPAPGAGPERRAGRSRTRPGSRRASRSRSAARRPTSCRACRARWRRSSADEVAAPARAPAGRAGDAAAGRADLARLRHGRVAHRSPAGRAPRRASRARRSTSG